MGQEAKKRAEVRHMRKLFNGTRTADELHRQLGIRKRCIICGGPPAIRIRVLATLKELQQRAPQYLAAVQASNPDGPTAPLPYVPTKYGPMLKVSDSAFCDLCKTQAEREAARGPSWFLVDIDRGPGKDRPFISVPR